LQANTYSKHNRQHTEEEKNDQPLTIDNLYYDQQQKGQLEQFGGGAEDLGILNLRYEQNNTQAKRTSSQPDSRPGRDLGFNMGFVGD